MPTFVADEHVPFETIRILREAGFVVISVREDYRGMKDKQILQLADKNSAVVITSDSDFGDMIFRDKVPFSSGLIYFRLSHYQTDEMAKMLLYRIREYGDEFNNRFTVISRRRFRQRPL
jgi:predicted nuclease of predicted toxin-antitoxin system